MRVQDVVKAIMKSSDITQREMAERFGKPGQSAIGMMLNGNSMKVENLLKILDECGYELVARSRDGYRPEFLIGDVQPENVVVQKPDEEYIKKLIDKAVAEKLKMYRKADRAAERRRELEDRPNDIEAGKVKLPDLDE